MTFIASLRLAFARTTGFLTVPVTTLLVTVYIAVTISTLVTDQIDPVPSPSTLHSRYGGLNVTEAYEDLHVIAARPHPYHSHANDVVRAYLLQRVRDIRSQSSHFIIDDDVTSNGTWANAASSIGTYFEGNNILVKVPGTDTTIPPLPAVLFSAHFDCVSTASGATDDGMGIVTLLQLIKYFACTSTSPNRPFQHQQRTLGSKTRPIPSLSTCMDRPLSTLKVPLAAGGLYYSVGTDIGALRSWKTVETPHANVISSEAFNLGLIRSATDYAVYTSAFAVPKPLDSTKFAPMRGLDFSFYRSRSKYHTKFDAIPYTEGGDKAVWAMMQPAWAAGVALANDDNESPSEERAVYFELFNVILILFPLTYLLTFNITSLVVGPIALILVAISESALARSRAAKRQQATFSPSIVRVPELEIESSASQILSPSTTVVNESSAQHEDIQVGESENRKNTRVSHTIWKHGRFWIALVLTIGAQVGLVAGFVNLNAFVAYGNLTAPLLSSFTLAILVPSFVLSPPHFATAKVKILSRAPTTTNCSCLDIFPHIAFAQLRGISYMPVVSASQRRLNWSLIQVPDDEVQPTDDDDETEANERTPLVGRKPLRALDPRSAHIRSFSSDHRFPYRYVSHSLIEPNIIAALPAIPFIGLAWIPWSGVWAVSAQGFKGGLFPFSEDAPLKVFFQQKVELSHSSSSSSNANAKVVTTLTGAAPFLQDMILPLIPSYLDSVAHGREVNCSSMNVDQRQSGLVKCSWETYNSGVVSNSVEGLSTIPVASTFDLQPALTERNHSSWNWTSTTNPWLQAYAKPMTFNGTTLRDGARFFITGNNSRACRVYFDHPVEKFRVRTVDAMTDLVEGAEEDGSDVGWDAQRGFKSDSYDIVRLWSREWGKSFIVDVQWSKSSSSSSSSAVNTPTNQTRSKSGRIACEWVEYESGMVGMGLSTSPVPSPSGKRLLSGGQIPAFEEVLAYIPKWAAVTKLTDGLVEVEERFGL
ncbi:hypothetical protein BT96DRAFT_999504 [Gymnopus androsaceus JB14]|uniref:Peptide hydrolase n=1 Tax=Gymnopus androsaceus JB14 TaxID=1447944 RepID=A0A6A4H7T2_9AGAR|nr:hypothetical protein BT96DRAFT_999504 [Gymnopus androsaceus JB14]